MPKGDDVGAARRGPIHRAKLRDQSALFKCSGRPGTGGNKGERVREHMHPAAGKQHP